MISNMQPHDDAFGVSLGTSPHVSPSLLPKSQRDIILFNLAYAGLDVARLGFNFNHQEERAEIEHRRKKRLEEMRDKLLGLGAYRELYVFTSTVVAIAGVALQEAHEEIADQIEEIERQENAIDASMDKAGVDKDALRSQKKNLRRAKSSLRESHDELHSYERAVLRPARRDLAVRPPPSAEKLRNVVTRVTSEMPGRVWKFFESRFESWKQSVNFNAASLPGAAAFTQWEPPAPRRVPGSGPASRMFQDWNAPANDPRAEVA